MRTKISLVRTGRPEVRLLVDADPSMTVSELADEIARTGLQEDAYGQSGMTLSIEDALTSELSAKQALDPNAPISSVRLTSGSRVKLLPGDEFRSAARARFAGATLRLRSGSNAGATLQLSLGRTIVASARDGGIEVVGESWRGARVAIEVSDERVNVWEFGEAIDSIVAASGLDPVSISSSEVVTLGSTSFTIHPWSGVRTDGNAGARVGFARSPRFVPTLEDHSISIPLPPNPTDMRREIFYVLGAPVLFGFYLSLQTGSVASLLLLALAPLGLLLAAIWSYYFGSGKQDRIFLQSIRQTKEKIDALHSRELEIRNLDEPSVLDALKAVSDRGAALWSRRADDEAFLRLKLGTATGKSRAVLVKPKINQGALRHHTAVDDLVLAASSLAFAPVSIDLGQTGAIGIIGSPEERENFARALITQVVSFHSPEDVRFAAILSPESASDWGWLHWLPHGESTARVERSHRLAADSASHLQLLEDLESEVEARLQPVDQAANSSRSSWPSTVVLAVDVPEDVWGRLARVAERGIGVGFTFIWCASLSTGLPAVCNSLVEVSTLESMVRFGGSNPRELLVKLESLDIDLADRNARLLAPIVDLGAEPDDQSDLPRVVEVSEFLEQPKGTGAEWQVEKWAETELVALSESQGPSPRRRPDLRAVIGRARIGNFELDLVRDGPHALVAGTTGSGKSEFLISWILSLASAYSPRRVTFLLVDYKGGSAFADCVNLPHCTGLVTELSSDSAERLFRSLRAELDSREQVLVRKRLMDFRSLERLGDPDTPPRVVVVVDEFAGLAHDHPDFLASMLEIARRGRSLGVHLIMATQRPAGVVDPDLVANLNIRIALRTADSDDSISVIGDPRAASFDPWVPGRLAARWSRRPAALFQSVYSGGWSLSKPAGARVPARIVELAFGTSSEWEQAEPSNPERLSEGPTDASRLVSLAKSGSALSGNASPKKVWLDELAMAFDLFKLPNPRSDELLLLGVQDLPDSQSQLPVYFEPDRDGSLLILGGVGSGKSAALRTLAISSGIVGNGGPVHVYGLDFGRSGRAGLSWMHHLQHVQVIAEWDIERVVRLVRILGQTVADRLDRYSKVKAKDLTEYRKLAAAENEPRILLLVDDIGALHRVLATNGLQATFESLESLAVEGRPLGVHLVATANRMDEVPQAIQASATRRLVLRLDSEEDYTILGIRPPSASGVWRAGRGMLDGSLTQLAIPGGDSNPTTQERVAEDFSKAQARALVTQLPPVPSLSDPVLLDDLPATNGDLVVIGIEDEDLQPTGINAHGLFLLAGANGSDRSTSLLTIVRALRRAIPELVMVHLSQFESTLVEAFDWDLSARGSGDVLKLASDLTQIFLDVNQPTARYAIIFEGLPDFSGSNAEAAVNSLVRLASRRGDFILGEGETSSWAEAWSLSQPFRAGRRGLILDPQGTDGESLFGTSLGNERASLSRPGRGYTIESGKARLVQIAFPAPPYSGESPSS